MAAEKLGKVKATPGAGRMVPQSFASGVGAGTGVRDAVFCSGKMGDQEQSAADRLEESPQASVLEAGHAHGRRGWVLGCTLF